MTLVYSLDTSVSPKDPKARGWIPESEAICKADADRVHIRPLNTDERAECNDAGGFHKRNLARVRVGLVAINDVTKRRKREKCLTSWAPICVSLLGIYIRDISEGDDPDQAKYTEALERPDDDSESESEDENDAGD